MIDVISRGRLEAGFVRGVPYEISPANSNPVRMNEREWEAIDMIVAKKDEPTSNLLLAMGDMMGVELDSIGIAAFIGATGGSVSPFFPLYLLAAAAVAMRFELKQAVMTCLAYAFTYAIASDDSGLRVALPVS